MNTTVSVLCCPLVQFQLHLPLAQYIVHLSFVILYHEFNPWAFELKTATWIMCDGIYSYIVTRSKFVTVYTFLLYGYRALHAKLIFLIKGKNSKGNQQWHKSFYCWGSDGGYSGYTRSQQTETGFICKTVK